MLQLDDKDRILLDQHQIYISPADAEISQDQIQAVETLQTVRQRDDRAPLIRMFRLLANPHLDSHCGSPFRSSTYMDEPFKSTHHFIALYPSLDVCIQGSG